MPVPSERADTARTLLRDQAYTQLRDAILDGTLEPGEQLRDAELAEWLGLSRTPIREAVARLEEYGLVETKPNSYTRVTPLSARDARDAFTVYAALEALAASLAVPRLTGDDLKTMRAANGDFADALAAADVDAAVSADDRFHGVLVQAAANGEIARSSGCCRRSAASNGRGSARSPAAARSSSTSASSPSVRRAKRSGRPKPCGTTGSRSAP
jgi:DNA-binding GntR family transcriptional regulator